MSVVAPALLLSSCGWFGGDDVDKNATGQAAEKAKAAATNDELGSRDQ